MAPRVITSFEEALANIHIPEVAEQLQVQVDRMALPENFYWFCRQAWEPAFGHPFIDGIHIQALCYHLQALWEGQFTTLVANLPPGLGKSSISTVLLPSWIWLKDASAGLWFSSFGQDTLDRDSLTMRRLIESDWWKKRFGHLFHLLDDQNQKRRYDNNKGGWRLAASIEARRGFGEHPAMVLCVHPDGKIRTNQGDIRIEEIVTKRLDVKFLSYNETTRETEWDDILEYETNPANRSMVELTAHNGMSCCITEEHRVFVDNQPQGYIAASMIGHGHALMCHCGTETASSSVSSVRRMWQRPDSVYNLRIKKNHNYFVNGILTHNCDDPHDPEQAVSEAERKTAIDYWTNKISTRGWVRGVKRAIVCQRLHELDLSAYVIEHTPKVVHLYMPMEFEPERRCITPLKYRPLLVNGPDPMHPYGPMQDHWEDPRTEEGQLLWPEGAPADKVAELKSNMRRAHAIAGQLQQRPTAPAGDMFLAEWFTNVVDEYPKNCPTVRAWDLASSTGSRADETAGVLGTFDGEFVYIIHACWGKEGRKIRNDLILKQSDRDAEQYADYTIRFEYEGGSAGKDAPEIMAEELTNLGFRVRIDKPLGKPVGDDQSLKGWERFADLLSRGQVKFVRGPWMQKLVEQCLAAPFGRHDDLIDAASRVARSLCPISDRTRVNRPLLLVTPEEEDAFQATNNPYVERTEYDELQSIFDAACASLDSLELGVWI